MSRTPEFTHASLVSESRQAIATLARVCAMGTDQVAALYRQIATIAAKDAADDASREIQQLDEAVRVVNDLSKALACTFPLVTLPWTEEKQP